MSQAGGARVWGASVSRAAWLVAVLGLGSSCYLQLSAGLYSVPRTVRPAELAADAPVVSLGIAAGFAYDPLTARVLVGPGGQGLPVNRAVTLTGPLHGQFDLALSALSQPEAHRRAVFRLGVGGSMQFAGRYTTNPTDGRLELRPATLAHVYLAPSVDVLFGRVPLSFVTAGLALTPGLFFAVGNRTYPDFVAPGGDVRLTFTLPLARGGTALADLFSSLNRDLTPEEKARLEQLRRRGPPKGSSGEDAWKKQGDAIDRQNQYNNCINRGAPNCS